MGGCTYHSRQITFCSHLRINLITFLGQWTPQAKDLYDLLILTFSDASGRCLADLDFLQKNSGLSATEWEDLLQYTVQVCHQMVNAHSQDWHFIFTLGLKQSRQFQDLWFYKIHSSRYCQQIRGCCDQLYPKRKNHSSLENCKTVISLLYSLLNWTSWKIISTPSVPNQAYSLANEISVMCPTTISGILSRTTKLRPSRLQRKKSVLMFWTPGRPSKVRWQSLFLWRYNSVSIKGCENWL